MDKLPFAKPAKAPKRPRKALKLSTKRIPRSARPKARNAKRKASEWTRAYGSQARVAFVKELWCIVGLSTCRGACHNAHIEGDGMGRKANADKVVPLCPTHHAELHRMGCTEFEEHFGVNLAQAAAETEIFWQRAMTGLTRSNTR